MKKFQNILFFYSTVASAVLVIGSFFFLPAPHNLIMLVLFLPNTGFFWLALTNPSKVNANRWSLRMVAVLVIFTLAGTFGYWLTTKWVDNNSTSKVGSDDTTYELLEKYLAKIERLEDNNDALSKKIDTIVSIPPSSGDPDILGFKDESQQDVSEDSYNLPLGYLKMDPDLQVVFTNVYETPNATSKVAGNIVPEKIYPFFTNDKSWYEIELDNLKKAWVNEKFIVETDL